MTRPADQPRAAGGATAALVAIVLLSLNLRPAAVSVGPVLTEVRHGLGLSDVAASLLTSLPVVAFAVFGALAPRLARRVGPHRITLVSLLVVAAGLVARALVREQVGFMTLTLLALAGMAVANVLLPSLVRLHFPDRVGRITAIYTTALAVGLTAALVLTAPIAHAAHSWRMALAGWALLAVVAAVPWLRLAADETRLETPGRTIGFLDVARTPIGLAMAGFFALQSLQAYAVFGWFPTLWRDAGYSATAAGLLVGLLTATAIPLSLWAPAAVARPGDQRRVVAAIVSCYPVGYLGLVLAPHALAVPCAVLVGAATATFPIVLVLIGLRSGTPDATAALSGFTQPVGYLLSAIGPFGVGVLHAATGGWTVPLLALTALVAPLLWVALYAARPGLIEDQLAHRAAP